MPSKNQRKVVHSSFQFHCQGSVNGGTSTQAKSSIACGFQQSLPKKNIKNEFFMIDRLFNNLLESARLCLKDSVNSKLPPTARPTRHLLKQNRLACW